MQEVFLSRTIRHGLPNKKDCGGTRAHQSAISEKHTGGFSRDENRRAAAYRDLERAVLDGEFGPPRKPCVAYLPNPPTGYRGHLTLRLTGDQLVILRDYNQCPVEYLWAPRDLCARWFASRRIEPPPRAGVDAYNVEPLALQNANVDAVEPTAAAADSPLNGRETTPLLRSATDQEIHVAITAVYDEAKRLEQKPPNVKELLRPVKAKLNEAGLDAPYLQIDTCAEAPQHAVKRRKRGRTLKSEQSRLT
jgi:hypothetical protein